ncbi:uncharacterized protein [Argopecten irradians]|uniref:uncharacterized protein isoform X3 n=1 Tax=Argopecten irradians TaxID=31199 RepID=UPI0037189F03
MASRYPSQTETTNFARLSRLVLDVCSDILRDVLATHIPLPGLHAILKSQKHHLRQKLISRQLSILYPPGNVFLGTLKDLDFSLLYSLVRNIQGINISPHTKGWGKEPDATDRSLAANIDRLRVLRNEAYGHLPKASLSDTDFRRIWGTIRQCVFEIEQDVLSGDTYVKEVYNLLNVTMDPDTEKEYIERLKKQRDEFEAVVEGLPAEQESMSARQDTMETEQKSMLARQDTMETEQKSMSARQDTMEIEQKSMTARLDTVENQQKTMTANQEFKTKEIHPDLKPMIETTMNRIRTEKEKQFLETKAFHDAQDKLRMNKVLVIKGNTGDGKTSMALQLLRWLTEEEQCRKPLQLHKIKKLDLLAPNSNLVCIIDDIFGQKDISKSDEVEWNKRLKHVETLFVDKQNQTNILFITIRNEIFNALTEQSLGTVFTEENIVDLSSDTYNIKEEKQELLAMYTPKNFSWTEKEMKKILGCELHIGFPQCCHLFSKSDELQKKGAKFFENPFHFFKDALSKLPECCAILFLFLNNGEIKVNDLDPNVDKVDKTLLAQAFSIELVESEDQISLGNENKQVDFVRKSLDKLLGFLVRKDKYWSGEEVYRFDHESVHVTLALLYGKKTPVGYIKYPSQTETTNFARLSRLVLDVCSDILRDVLDTHIPLPGLHAILKSQKHNLRQKLKSRQLSILYPPGNVFPGTLEDLDFSLLYSLVRNLQGINISPHAKGWGREPDAADRSLAANIDRLRVQRNEAHGHLKRASLSNTDFRRIWGIIRQCISEIEQDTLTEYTYVREVDNLLNVTMDPDTEKELIQRLQEQQVEFETIVEGLKDEQKAVRAKQESMARDMEEMKEQYWKVDSIHSQASDIKILKKPSSPINMDETEGVESVKDKTNRELLVAIRDNDKQRVKDLLEKGADPNLGNVVEEAAWKGRKDILTLLLEKGADVNKGNVVEEATKRGNKDILTLLLEKGADVNKGNVVEEATKRGNKDILTLLLEKGADVNKGNVAASAARRGDKDILTLVLEKGADVNKGNVAASAAWRGDKDILTLVLEKGADVNKGNVVEEAAVNGDKDILTMVLEKGADVNKGNPLKIPARRGDTEIVDLLLEKGADINTKSALEMPHNVTKFIHERQALRRQQEYTKGILETTEHPCNITITVVGHKGVGKSCFVKQLKQEHIPKGGPGSTDTADFFIDYIAYNPDTGFRKMLDENSEIKTYQHRLKNLIDKFRMNKEDGRTEADRRKKMATVCDQQIQNENKKTPEENALHQTENYAEPETIQITGKQTGSEPRHQADEQTDPETLHQTDKQTEPETLHQTDKQTKPETLHQTDKQMEPETLHQTDKRTEPETLHQTDKQTEPETLHQTDKQTEPETLHQTDKQTEPETLHQTDKQTEPETLHQTDKQTEPETLHQTDKQTEPETLHQTDKQTESEIRHQVDKQPEPERPHRTENQTDPEPPNQTETRTRSDKNTEAAQVPSPTPSPLPSLSKGHKTVSLDQETHVKIEVQPTSQYISLEQKQVIDQIMETKTKEGEEEVKGFVTIYDFGGEWVFYNTHHCFMSSNMVFVLVFDVDMCLDKDRSIAGYEIAEYWLKAIATYALDDETRSKGIPPIILIGSHLDKVSPNKTTQNKMFAKVLDNLQTKQQLRLIMEDHVQEMFAIANLNDSTANKDVYEALWQKIIEIAPLQSQWKRTVPARWIAMEHELIRLKNKGHILLKYEELLDVNSKKAVPLLEEEIRDFLRYLKYAGRFLCFNVQTKHTFIVLQPQWIIDGFKQIITDDKFKTALSEEMKFDWESYKRTGVLPMDFLKKLWKEDRFHKNEKELRIVMETLSLLAQPIPKDHTDEANYYIVPSILPNTNPKLIEHIVQDPTRVVTVTLCLKFKKQFIPQAVWDKMIASCVHRFQRLNEPGHDGLNFIQRGFACLKVTSLWNTILNCKDNSMKITLFTKSKSATANAAGKSTEKNDHDKFTGVGVQLLSILEFLLHRILELNHQSHLEYQYYLHNDYRVAADDQMVLVDELRRTACVHSLDSIGYPWLNKEDIWVWFVQPGLEAPDPMEKQNETMITALNLPDRQLTLREIGRISAYIFGSYYPFFVHMSCQLETLEQILEENRHLDIRSRFTKVLIRLQNTQNNVSFSTMAEAMQRYDMNPSKLWVILDEHRTNAFKDHKASLQSSDAKLIAGKVSVKMYFNLFVELGFSPEKIEDFDDIYSCCKSRDKVVAMLRSFITEAKPTPTRDTVLQAMQECQMNTSDVIKELLQQQSVPTTSSRSTCPRCLII